MSQIITKGLLSARILIKGFFGRTVDFINIDTLITTGIIQRKFSSTGIIDRQLLTSGIITRELNTIGTIQRKLQTTGDLE